MTTDKKFTRGDKIELVLRAALIGGLIIAGVLAIPGRPTSATCTYDTSRDSGTGSGWTVASCNSTTEARPTLTTEGKPMQGVRAFNVAVVASGNMTAGGQFLATAWHPAFSKWIDVPDLTLTISAASTNQLWIGFLNPVPEGRLAFRPSAAGANNTLIYIIGSK